jgi:hypothetical protein
MVGGIFCVLEKAFDCVNHKILLSTLEFYGIKGKTKLWFESYFRNRYQRVLITNNVPDQNNFSTWDEILHGVLQIRFGPIVFPFLYQLFTQSHKRQIYTNIVADVTSILIASPNKNNFQIKVTAAFSFINEWLNTNLLFISFNKTHYVQFTTKNKPKTHIKIAYDNKQITTVPNIKFLGICINDTIN